MPSLLCCVELTKEFLMIYDKSPSRLQKKITEPIKMQVQVCEVCLVGSLSTNTGLCVCVLCVCVCMCVLCVVCCVA